MPVVETPAAGGGGGGGISPAAKEAVKRATVYVRVPGLGSGTGFFGAQDAPNLVLTNAHVVGMLSPDSPRPAKVEVVINSGERGEKTFEAKILGVDRATDLAVLDVGTSADLPKALTVRSAATIRELDEVYVFGFPLGEALGKEITIRQSSVASLRKRNGELHRIQCNGGMDPGNSGGPVVDTNGHVVGVAVAKILGTQIDFAIPGDRVHAILAGRMSSFTISDAYKVGGGVGVTIDIEMLDPRARVKDVALEVWTGDDPGDDASRRPPSDKPPAAKPGDSPRETFRMKYANSMATADVTLPALTPGKVYWVQPTWTYTDGKRHWVEASVRKLKHAPMERIEVALQFKAPSAAAPRQVTMSSTNSLRVGSSQDTEVYSLTTQVVLDEKVAISGTNMTFTLGYQSAKKTQTLGGRSVNADPPPVVSRAFPIMKAVFRMDASGNLVQNALGTMSKLQLAKVGLLDRKVLDTFHDPIKEWMGPLMLPVPNRTLKPRDTWKHRRTLGWHPPTGATVQVPLDLNCSYLGVRGAAGEQEAVIGLQGALTDPRMKGKVRGTMTVSVAGGAIKSVEMDVEMDVPEVQLRTPDGRAQKLKVLSVQTLRLNRGL
jgi:hypothetical protein